MTNLVAPSCEMIKAAANNTEREMTYYLDRLSHDKTGGWDKDTMAMLDLKFAEEILQSLILKIKAERIKFTAASTKQG